jgi:hypothetical protein
VACIFGQRPKKQKHVSACSVTIAKANNHAECGLLAVRRSPPEADEMKRNPPQAENWAYYKVITVAIELKKTKEDHP